MADEAINIIRPKYASDVSSDVTPSLHPQNVLSLASVDTPNGKDFDPAYKADLQPIYALFRDAYEALEHLHEARGVAKNDPTLTDDARILKLGELADGYQKKLVAKWDETHSKLSGAIKAIEGQFTADLKMLSDRVALGGEIRAHFKALPVEKRQAMLHEAQRTGDTDTVRAVLGSPAYLSGMTEEMRKIETRIYNEAQNPALSARLAMLKRAEALMEQRGGLLHTEIPRLMGFTWSRVDELKKKQTKTTNVFQSRI